LQLGNLAYDPTQDRLLLFDAPQTVAWRWDGAWHSQALASHPSSSSGMTYDPVRAGILRYDLPNTTWLFTDAWHATSALPATFTIEQMTYDFAASRAIGTTVGTTVTLGSSDTGWRDLMNGPKDAGTLAYDRSEGHAVAIDQNQVLVDMVNGTWQPSFVSTSFGFVLTSQLARASVLLVPASYNPGPASNSVWERSSGIWRQLEYPPLQIAPSSIVETRTGKLEILTQDYTAATIMLVERQYASSLPDETCAPGVDADGDGLAGCDDPDCWWACHPACPYAATCP